MRLAIVALAGALAAACTVQETRTVVPATPVQDACSAYGYTPGTEGYRICATDRFDRCVAREMANRRPI